MGKRTGTPTGNETSLSGGQDESDLCTAQYDYKISGFVHTGPPDSEILYSKDKQMRRYLRSITQDETKTGNCRHPLTYILEAADDLAYKTADIEDAFVKGLPYHAFKEELVCSNEQYPDSGFDGVLKLKEPYQRGQKRVFKIRRLMPSRTGSFAQGFLIDCATKGFMDHYERNHGRDVSKRSLSRYL